MKDWNVLKYNIKAVIENIRWRAFGIVSTLRDSLSDKKPAALLVRFLEITSKF